MIETTDPLDLGSDLATRYRYFTRASLAHPAKMHAGLLLWLVERYSAPGQTILDPMCGIGTTLLGALSQRDVVGYEIEPSFLKEAHRNAAQIIEAAGLFAGRITVAAHDARTPWPHQADVVLFSPPYGCEASPNTWRRQGILSHRIRQLATEPGKLGKRWESLANKVQHGAGASLRFHYGDHPAQLGHLRGDRYWREMEQVYAQALVALRPGGRLILVIKDHIRKGQRITVAADTAQLCESLGFTLEARHARRVWPLSLWQRRRKEKGEPIVGEEDILVFTIGERT